MSSTPVRHLLLDLAGVLCRFDRPARLTALAAAAGRPFEEVEEAVYGSGLVERGDRGEVDATELRAVLRHRLGLSCGDAELARLWASAFIPDEEVLTLLDRCTPTVTRSLLTNNDALLRDTLPQVLPQVHARIAVPLFSASLHATKPAAAAYAGAIDLLGAMPAEVLFVDDSADNVDGARRAGLSAVLFTDVAGLDGDLRRAGLLAS